MVVFAARYDSFLRILDHTEPDVVMSDCYYDRTWAVAAARDRGVPVWELQHGIVYDGHMAYTFDPSSTQAHREAIPVPDRVLTFGPHFRDIFLERGFWRKEQVEALGFARLSHLQGRFQWHAPGEDGTLEVLFSSQWILRERLASMLSEIAPRLDGVRITVKPHPLDPPGAYEDIPGVRVAGRGSDFYEALDGCHVHCSVFSTTLLESVGLGVPTLVIGLPGADGVSFLSDSGAARRVNGATALLELLNGIARETARLEDWRSSTMQSRGQFWSPDPGETMTRLLEEFRGRVYQ